MFLHLFRIRNPPQFLLPSVVDPSEENPDPKLNAPDPTMEKTYSEGESESKIFRIFVIYLKCFFVDKINIILAIRVMI